MSDRLPLPTLLSQVLVAFTIELDNEFERRMPHRTATTGSPRDPWLISMVMWFNCLRFLGERGLTAAQLDALARTRTNVDGMRRWGYLTYGPDPQDPRPKPPRSAWLLRAMPAGRRADETWRPLYEELEARWRDRFGAGAIAGLTESLTSMAAELPDELPDCLPILGYGLVSMAPAANRNSKGAAPPDTSLRHLLVVLLARVLNAFAIHFEGGSAVSLAISANVLRVLDEEGVPVRELPIRSGVSKESIAMALGYLGKKGLVTEVVKPEERARWIRLTRAGAAARDAYAARLTRVETDWGERFTTQGMGALRVALEALVGPGTAPDSPLFRGLEPYPDGWRASRRRPEALPHFPMVLHRGGYPDGS